MSLGALEQLVDSKDAWCCLFTGRYIIVNMSASFVSRECVRNNSGWESHYRE